MIVIFQIRLRCNRLVNIRIILMTIGINTEDRQNNLILYFIFLVMCILHWYMDVRILSIIALLWCNLEAQTVFVTKYKSEADVVLHEVQYRSRADIIIYKTEYRVEADAERGWFETDRSDADWTVYWTPYASEADCKVYFAEYKNQASRNDCFLKSNKPEKEQIERRYSRRHN